MQLAEILKSPLGYSFRGKYFSNVNPYAVGLNGLWATNRVLKLCIKPMSFYLGTDFPYSEFFEKCKIIQIDIKPERLGRLKVDLGYCGDIKLTLKELMPLVEIKLPLIFWTKCVHYIKILK
jgi:pyruvate dehydrogenase (quinone)